MSLGIQILLGHAVFYATLMLIGLAFYLVEQKKINWKKILKLPLNYYLFTLLAIPVHVIGICALLMGKSASVVEAYWNWFDSFIV